MAKQRTKFKKCTAAEKERRIDEGAAWIYENPDYTWTEFIERMERLYDLKMDTANKYYKDCIKRVGHVIAEDAESAKRLRVRSLQNLLKKAVKEGELKLQLDIQREIGKIQGAYTTKIEFSDTTEKPLFNVDPIKESNKDKGN